jgi:Zn-dependent protease with chaperone function
MGGYVLLSETKARFSSLDRQMARSKLLEAGEGRDISVDQWSLAGVSEDWLMDFRFEWEIRSEDEAYVVVEKKYVDRWWFYFFIVSILSAAIGFVFTVISSSVTPSEMAEMIYRGESILLYIFTGLAAPYLFMYSAFVFMIVLMVFLYYSGLVPDLRGATSGYESQSPFMVPIMLFAMIMVVGFVGVFVGSMVLMGLVSVLLLALFLSLVLDPLRFQDLSGTVRENNPLFDLPVVAGEYVLILLPALGPLFVIWVGYDWFVNYFWVILGSIFIFLLFSVAQLKWIMWLVSGNSVLDVFYDVKQYQNQGFSSRERVIMGFFVVGMSYSVFGFLVLVSARYSEILLQPLRYPFQAVIFLFAVLPATYFIAGIVYQTVFGVKEKLELLENSASLDLGIDSSAELLKVDSVRNSPASLSTGFNHYIFVPAEIAVELDEVQLEAIVAHEEKHIRSGEAFLAFVMPVLSVLLMTGQNVIYALLDFRQREFAADRFAADKVGEDAVISALDEMSRVVESERSELTWWQDQFGMFYGTFAQSQAHPSVKERVRELENEDMGERADRQFI